MIKQAFVFHSPSVEKAGGEEALWLCALLHSSHWDKEPPVRGGKAWISDCFPINTHQYCCLAEVKSVIVRYICCLHHWCHSISHGHLFADLQNSWAGRLCSLPLLRHRSSQGRSGSTCYQQSHHGSLPSFFTGLFQEAAMGFLPHW